MIIDSANLMTKTSIFAVLLTASFFVQPAEDVEKKVTNTKQTQAKFYDTRKEGWYWFEEDSEELPKEEPAPTPPPPPKESEPSKMEGSSNSSESVNIVINAEWLRVNLPTLRESAINEPTDENLSAYYYAQRMTVDMASRFANRTKEFFADESALDENNRRPTTGFVLSNHKKAATTQRKVLLREIYEEAGLWVFVRSDCGFCKKQIPVLEELKRIYGVDILYISLDGQEIPDHRDANYVYDVSGVARERLGFEVELTPTIILLKNDGTDAVLLNSGLVDLNTIEEKTLRIAKNSGWVSDDDFMSTQQVKDITTLQGDEVLDVDVRVDTEEETTKALILKIKNRLKSQPRSSGSIIQGDKK